MTDQTETTKHKRCPFCGNREDLYLSHMTAGHWVICPRCKATGPIADTPAGAWEKWDAPRPKRKRKKAPALNTIRLTIEEYQRLALMASDLQQLKAEQSGGMPKNAIIDLLMACEEGARTMADNDALRAIDLQDLLNNCISRNPILGGVPGKAHFYAQVASVHEGVYR